MHRSTAITALMLLAGSASAQSFNIDINHVQGNYPTKFYSAAGKAGYWNDINMNVPATVNLAAVDSPGSTPVTLTWDKSVSTGVKNDANTTGNAESLLDDGQFRTSAGSLVYTVKHLQAGTYAVFTYAGHPTLSGQTSVVAVAGGISNAQTIGGNVTNALPLGTSHALHFINVPADGTITVVVSNNGLSNACCTGLQLVKMDDLRLRFYVDKSQSANPADGNSWATAYSDLGDLLTHLGPVGGAYAEIWVRQGFYYTDDAGDRTKSFVIPSGVALYGGFSGTETSLADRTSPWSFITALSGSIGGSGASDNAYHVVDASNVNSGTSIDGFTIASGYANGIDGKSMGGGLYAPGARLAVNKCKFISNHALSQGGATYTTASVTFDGCLFYKNDSTHLGGAVFHELGGTAAFRNCQFFGNTSIDYGAAAHIFDADSSFFNCLFSGNKTTGTSFGLGGALYFYGDANDVARLVNCTLSHNSSASLNGAFYADDKSVVDLHNCILANNTDANPAGPQFSSQYDHYTFAVVNSSSTSLFGYNQDPHFVDPSGADNVYGTTDDNCRPTPDAPYLDAGDNSLVPWDFGDADGDNSTFELYPFDLDHLDRVADVPWATDVGGNGNIDRGCYEYQFSTCPADFDVSGFVDLDDYTAFVAAFEAGTQNADFDGTGFVDTDDFTAFVVAFEAGC